MQLSFLQKSEKSGNIREFSFGSRKSGNVRIYQEVQKMRTEKLSVTESEESEPAESNGAK